MVKEFLKTPLGQFRIVAFLEGCSYLLFGLTMPLKYFFGLPQANYVVGMLHGTLFMLYIFLLLRVSILDKWRLPKIILAFLAAFIPFGTFLADKKLFRENILEKNV